MYWKNVEISAVSSTIRNSNIRIKILINLMSLSFWPPKSICFTNLVWTRSWYEANYEYIQCSVWMVVDKRKLSADGWEYSHDYAYLPESNVACSGSSNEKLLSILLHMCACVYKYTEFSENLIQTFIWGIFLYPNELLACHESSNQIGWKCVMNLWNHTVYSLLHFPDRVN